MNPPDTSTWPAANQRHLMAAVAAVRARLDAHAAKVRGESPEAGGIQAAEQAIETTRAALSAPAALETLCARFGLSPFERDVLLLCAGLELDGSLAAACAGAQGDTLKRHATFSLALAALPEPHWSALSPAAPLRRWRLIECRGPDLLTLAPLRIDERVLHFLTGLDVMDERLHGWVGRIDAAAPLPASQQAVARQAAAVWADIRRDTRWPVVQFCGSDPAALRAVAAAACAAVGLRLHGLRPADLPGSATERESLIRLWERETALGAVALLVELDQHDTPEQTRAAAALVEEVNGIVLLAGREALGTLRRTGVRFDVPNPGAREQRGLWEAALGDAGRQLNGELDRVVAQFSLGSHRIHAASAEALAGGAVGGPALAGELWRACRLQARQRLDDLARRIEPAATWGDIVLPPEAVATLREIAGQVRQRATVYEKWGFAAKSARGLGISALFAGASGTGKTMAAEVLAHELDLDLYQVDLSALVSKYIGETEKNLRRVFDAAEEGGAILLFDEADALFGKRSEVNDSHDRYANIEVSYLLQRMESYRGLAILTTNMKESLDTAFLRRLRFVVQFPFPDAAHRAEIWRRVFPAETPLGALNHSRLSRLDVAGGNIRNMALNAAFLAAEAREPVRMSHLLLAAQSEYAKLEKSLGEMETKGWV
jgi:hypothetical protein